MKTITVYEWDVETLDENEDIIDHNHADHLRQHATLENNERLVLVRDVLNSVDDDLEERYWAYVTDGKLPEYFSDARGEVNIKVPQRFHKELKRYLNK